MKYLSHWQIIAFMATVFLTVYIRFVVPTNFLDNLVSSIIALTLGIPVAIYLNRSTISEENKYTLSLDHKREKEILSLLKDELEFSYSDIFLASRKNNANNVQTIPYKVELWDTFSSSGQLSVIKNPVLLNRLSSTYYEIKSIQKIENMAFESNNSATVMFDNVTAAQRLLDMARGFDKQLESNLIAAIEEINSYLESQR